MKDFISRDIEAKIADFNKRKENRIKKVEHIVTRGEMSVEDIKQRMQKAQAAVQEGKEVSYDLLPSNEKKVRLFELLSFKTLLCRSKRMCNVSTYYARSRNSHEYSLYDHISIKNACWKLITRLKNLSYKVKSAFREGTRFNNVSQLYDVLACRYEKFFFPLFVVYFLRLINFTFSQNPPAR